MKPIFAFISACLLCLLMPFVSNAAVLPAAQVTDDEKMWTVKFSNPVSTASNWQNRFSVLRDDGTRHPIIVQRSTDGKSITLTPTEPYLISRSYRVVVSAGVTSTGGTSLKAETVRPFSVQGTAIQSVEAAANPLATNVIVQTSGTASRVTVTAGGYETDLHRGANNRFSRGMIGLLAGDRLTVQAYGTNGRVQETYFYEVTTE